MRDYTYVIVSAVVVKQVESLLLFVNSSGPLPLILLRASQGVDLVVEKEQSFSYFLTVEMNIIKFSAFWVINLRTFVLKSLTLDEKGMDGRFIWPWTILPPRELVQNTLFYSLN